MALVINESTNAGQVPRLTRKRIIKEIERFRLELAQDLKKYESAFPNPTEKTLSRVITE